MARAGAQAFIAPRRVPEPEQVPPVSRFERDCPARRPDGCGRLARAHEDERQGAVCLGQRVVELHGLAAVRDRPLEQIPRRLVSSARVDSYERELRVRQPVVGERVSRIDRHGMLEVGDGARQFPDVERFDAQPALHHGAVRFQARGLASVRRGRGRPREAELRGELRGDLVLQREDVVQLPVHLRVRDGFAADDVDHTGRDADARAVASGSCR